MSVRVTRSMLQLKSRYSWKAEPGDDPTKRRADARLFNRREGYEVLPMIQNVVDHFGYTRQADALKVEDVIATELPGDVRGRKRVLAWLIDRLEGKSEAPQTVSAANVEPPTAAAKKAAADKAAKEKAAAAKKAAAEKAAKEKAAAAKKAAAEKAAAAKKAAAEKAAKEKAAAAKKAAAEKAAKEKAAAAKKAAAEKAAKEKAAAAKKAAAEKAAAAKKAAKEKAAAAKKAAKEKAAAAKKAAKEKAATAKAAAEKKAALTKSTRAHAREKPADTASGHERRTREESRPIIVDLGKHKKKRVKRLLKGKGRILRKVSRHTANLRATGHLTVQAQVIVVVVREKKRRR